MPRGPAGYLSVTASTFTRQLDWLLSHGFAIESIENAFRLADSRVVGLSFDDGHESHYTKAFPLLAERGVRATFFVVTDWVGTQGYVTWNQLRQMTEAGMSIGSHTVSHPFLSTLTVEEVLAELRDSKARIDDELKQATRSLALPGGDLPTEDARSVFEEAGYRLVATSRVGTNKHGSSPHDGLHFLPRMAVRHGQSQRHFERIILQDRATLCREYLRSRFLGAGRTFLGPRRYAKWRKAVLTKIR